MIKGSSRHQFLFSIVKKCVHCMWLQVYDQLKMRVASPSFLDKLKPFQDDGASTSSNKTLLRAEGITLYSYLYGIY